MSLTITGDAGSATFSTPSAGWVRSADRYHVQPLPSGGEQRVEDHFAPGGDGASEKDHGFGGRNLQFLVAYVGASASAVWGLIETDAGIRAGNCSVSWTGGSAAACQMLPYEVVKPPKKTGYGTVCAVVRLSFRQKRSA